MIDALLFAVRDACRERGFDAATCDIRATGAPTPGCGDTFLAVHQAAGRSDMDNALNEYFAFDLTLTYRVTVPLDRLGDQELAKNLAKKAGPKGNWSLNARLEDLKLFFHMNWLLLQRANTYLCNLVPDGSTVYGFCEPPRYRTIESPHFEGPDWFGAEAADDQVGLVNVLHFDDCRRLQALEMFT